MKEKKPLNAFKQLIPTLLNFVARGRVGIASIVAGLHCSVTVCSARSYNL